MARVSWPSGVAAVVLLTATLRGWQGWHLADLGGARWAGEGKEGLEKHWLQYFWKGSRHFSLNFTTHSSNIFSRKASNRNINAAVLIPPEQF